MLDFNTNLKCYPFLEKKKVKRLITFHQHKFAKKEKSSKHIFTRILFLQR